jgi:hypothetical protein
MWSASGLVKSSVFRIRKTYENCLLCLLFKCWYCNYVLLDSETCLYTPVGPEVSPNVGGDRLSEWNSHLYKHLSVVSCRVPQWITQLISWTSSWVHNSSPVSNVSTNQPDAAIASQANTQCRIRNIYKTSIILLFCVRCYEFCIISN